MNKPFSVLMLYDEPVAREQALSVCSRLPDRTEGRIDLECDSRSFKQLQDADAAGVPCAGPEADLLIVSTVRRDGLPASCKTWIERWLSRAAKRDSAMGVLVGSPTPEEQPTTPVHRHLQTAAHNAGVPCFLGRFDLPRFSPVYSRESVLARAMTVTTVMEQILRLPPPARWGINE